MSDNAPRLARPQEQFQALSGVRILDLSRWAAGEYAAKLFADFGADVIKVEKPGEGSLTRHWGPFPGDVHNPEASALFLHLNTNKRSIALDLKDPADVDVLLGLIETADALVESFRPGHLESLGLGPDVLRKRNPRLVITRISAFGQDGPYRDREATGIVVQASGGPMNATGAADRAPLRKPGLLEHYTIGRTAGEATMAGLLAARDGTGSVIDVSGQEVLLAGADRRASYLLSASYSGMVAPRGVRSPHRHGATFTGPFRTSDGFVMIYVTNQVFWNRLVDLVGADAPDFHARFHGRQTVSGQDRDDFLDHIAAWCLGSKKIDLMERCEAARIPVTAFLEISELLEHPHFRGRGAFAEIEHPVAGTLTYTGAPWRMRHGYAARTAAPLLDQHGAQLRDEHSTRRHAEPAGHAETGSVGTHPLDGVRVVDLTVVWSGPGATALLGDLGAEVIRLEGNNRASRQVSAKTTKELIASTGYHGGTYPDKDPGERPYDRTALFNWHSRNKLAACANLETPEGLAAALALLAKSDVLVENNANGTLEKLGLGHKKLLELNPRLIVVRMPPMGMTGPMSNYLGYGPNFNSLVGIAAMDGYEGEGPDSAGENYHMDEAAPAGVAFAVMTALLDRERTGLGGLIEFPQAEAVMAEIGEFVLDQQMNDRNPDVLGNTDPRMLQDVFLSADADRWLAVSVRDDRDWNALVTLVDCRALEEMGGTAALRAENSAPIRAVLADWCRARSAEEAVSELQAVGVPAGEVMSEDRLLSDPHLAARGWFRERDHPSVGTYRYPGHPWRAEGFSLAFGRAVPGFGEDNEYVYREVLGYTEEHYADLVARRLVTDQQIA